MRDWRWSPRAPAPAPPAPSSKRRSSTPVRADPRADRRPRRPHRDCVQGSLVQAGGEPLTTSSRRARSTCAPAWRSRLAAGRRGARAGQGDRPRSSTRRIAHVPPRRASWCSSTQIDPATGAVPIKVRLAGPSPGALLSGQGVRLRLLLGSGAGCRRWCPRRRCSTPRRAPMSTSCATAARWCSR
jgi:hypothetical protein